MDIKKLTLINDSDVDIFVDNAYIDRIDSKEYRHPKARLLYAEGGIIHLFSADRHWYIPARFYMWIPANTTYHLESRSSHIQLYSFYFKVKPYDSPYYNEPKAYLTNDLLREMLIATKNWQGIINKTSNYGKYSFLRAIKAILPELSTSSISFPLQHPYPQDEKLRTIAQFLNEHISESYTLAHISARFGMSSRTLSRLFKEKVGMSYVRFLRAIRMAKALELMAYDKYSILEIALMVGYHELSSFSNIFYRVTGIRPSEYMAKINHYKR